jgi:hypothetical protein
MERYNFDEWVDLLTKPAPKNSGKNESKSCILNGEQDLDEWKAKINKQKEKNND